ncbi:MAG: hypothetical protein WCV85_02540 [Patescibacteria group bacterium]
MTPNVIIIGDFLKDLDDEHALVLAAAMHRSDLINLRCVIGNLAPAVVRAQGAKATLVQLGLPNIPVGVGLPVYIGKFHPYEHDLPYIASGVDVHEDGQALLVRTLQACPDNSVILVLQSGLTDAAQLLRDHEDLCREKLMHVAIMGGVEFVDDFMVPNNASNNSFDWEAAVWLHRRLQELDIRMVITTREAAYAVQFPLSAYSTLLRTGHPVAECLYARQLQSYQRTWIESCGAPGSEERGSLPLDRDRQWFIRVYCNGADPGIADGADITPFVTGFNLYDSLNLWAALPENLQLSDYFLPIIVRGMKAQHCIVGYNSKLHGVTNPEALRAMLLEMEVLAFSHSVSNQEKRAIIT